MTFCGTWAAASVANGGLDVCSIVIRPIATTTQDEMAVLIAACADNCGMPAFGGAEKTVRTARRNNGINRNLHIAIGRVLEADRAGKP